VELSWLYFAMIFPLLIGMILRAGYPGSVIFSHGKLLFDPLSPRERARVRVRVKAKLAHNGARV
jgi:hypothetical protein